MIKVLLERFRQKHRTLSYPKTPAVLPDRFRGKPVFEPASCGSCKAECLASCPTDALSRTQTHSLSLDMGHCLFCLNCSQACPSGAIRFSRNHAISARTRQDLILSPSVPQKDLAPLKTDLRALLGRSLKLRQVSAAGCNACEADTNVLNTLAYDLGRFGIQFVASPRHADGLLVTGPVSKNMELALKKTWEAVPSPKIVIAVGACAIGGGPYRDHREVLSGVDSLIPVDLYVPGCPPHPLTILEGLLGLLGRIQRLE